jgi:hypothetical protein
MIYRRPPLAQPGFVLSVIAATTGAVLGAGACADTMVPAPSAADDATEDVFSSTPSCCGGSISSGVVSGSSGSSSGSGASSGGCLSSSGTSSGAYNLIVYDATNDAIENLDMGLDAPGDSSTDGAAGTGDAPAETADGVAETGDL